MNPKLIPVSLLVLILLVSCVGSVQIPISFNPTPTRAAIASPTPTSTPISVLPVAIGSANASKLVQLASMGDALLYNLSYSPDGQWLVVYSSAGLKFYNSTSLAPIPQPAATQPWTGPPVFSPDGKTVAFVAAGNKTVTLLEAATGNVTQTLSGQTATFGNLALSPDGKTLETNIGGKQVSSTCGTLPPARYSSL